MALEKLIVSLNDLINHEAKRQTGSCLGIDVFYFFLKRFFSDIRENRSPSLQSKDGQSPDFKIGSHQVGQAIILAKKVGKLVSNSFSSPKQKKMKIVYTKYGKM